jgi:hypothetical protein
MQRLEQRFSVTTNGLSMKWVLTNEEPRSEEHEPEGQEDAQQERAPLALCA